MSRGLLLSLDEQVQAGLLGNKRQVGQAYIEVPLDQQHPGDLADSHIPVNETKHSQPALIHPAKLSVCGIIDQIDDVLNITIDFEIFYGLSLVLTCLLIVMLKSSSLILQFSKDCGLFELKGPSRNSFVHDYVHGGINVVLSGQGRG